MAAIKATQYRIGNWTRYRWTAVTESDTATAQLIPMNISDSHVYYSGTFGGSTATFAGGFTEVATGSLEVQSVKDKDGNTVSKTSAGASEITSHWPYMGPVWASGSSQSAQCDLWVCIVDRPSRVGLQG